MFIVCCQYSFTPSIPQSNTKQVSRKTFERAFFFYVQNERLCTEHFIFVSPVNSFPMTLSGEKQCHHRWFIYYTIPENTLGKQFSQEKTITEQQKQFILRHLYSMYRFSPPPQLVGPNIAPFTPTKHNSLPLHSCANISVTYFPQEGKVDNRVFDGLQA